MKINVLSVVVLVIYECNRNTGIDINHNFEEKRRNNGAILIED